MAGDFVTGCFKVTEGHMYLIESLPRQTIVPVISLFQQTNCILYYVDLRMHY